MQFCPHCGKEINLREIPYQGLFRNFRECPRCSGYFTVDKKTKRRQVIFLFILLVSLALTILLNFEGSVWLIPAIVSYLIIGIGIYLANKRVFLVPYQNDKDR